MPLRNIPHVGPASDWSGKKTTFEDEEEIPSPRIQYLSSRISRKILLNELIADILKHFLQNTTMSEDDYAAIIARRISSNCRRGTRTKWKGGNRGALRNLHYHASVSVQGGRGGHSWMSKEQGEFGDIIIVNEDGTISLTPTWRAAFTAISH